MQIPLNDMKTYVIIHPTLATRNANDHGPFLLKDDGHATIKDPSDYGYSTITGILFNCFILGLELVQTLHSEANHDT